MKFVNSAEQIFAVKQ